MRRLQKTGAVSLAVKPQPAAAAGIDTNLSVESMTIEQVLTGRVVPSLEDEVEALQEADTLQEQASADVAETSRVEDVTDVMLNVADTIEDAGELTPQQAMLTDTVSEMAVAGSDGDPDDVMPSAADVVEGNVSVESFVDTVRKKAAEIWARIREFCLQIWNTIKEFFKRIFHAAPRLLHRVKQLRDEVALKKKSAAGAQAASAGVMIHTGMNAVSYPGYMVHDTKELVKGLNELQSLGKYAFGDYLKNCKSMSEQVAAELKKYDPKKAQAALETVAVGLQKNNFTNVMQNPPTGFLGCFDLVPNRLDKNKTKDLSHAQIVAALRHTGVSLRTRAGGAGMIAIPARGHGSSPNGFATMSFAEMDQVLSQVEAMVKQMVAFETSADMKAIEKARNDLIEGGNQAAAATDKFGGDDEAGKMERAFALDVMRSLANFNTTLTRWMTELTMPVTKKIYQTSRVALVLVDKSLSQYKVAPAAV